MKRKLFAIFLAVTLVVAMVFVIAPAAKAEESTVVQAQADGTMTVPEGKILDLNGFDVIVETNAPLCVIDTKNTSRTGEGENVGTVKNNGTGAVVAVSQDPVTLMRYLALPNEDGTYSAHPFNLTISQLGLNTLKEAICLRASFMANNKVIKEIKDHGIYIGGRPETAKENYPFTSNFIDAYADLTGSLEDDAALDVSKTAKAYIKIGEEYIYSTNEANITPRQVLKGLNNGTIVGKYTENQKAAVDVMSKKDHLKDLFTVYTKLSCTHSATAPATCLTPETCKNCDGKLGEVTAHKDDNADTKCDWCALKLSDYVELDASELVGSAKKPQTNYISYGDIYDRTNVYGASFPSDWSAEVVAKTSVTKDYYADSLFGTWANVRSNYKTKGYQYISVNFALSEGAKITVAAAIPSADASKVVTSGPVFEVGRKMSWGSGCQGDTQKALFTVYSNGREVTAEDTIKAGQWYTVVIKLLTDVDGYIDGESSYSSVAFSGGNGGMVYFSGVRYYTNDSYKEDFAPDYDEMDATELVVYKNKDKTGNVCEDYDQKNITINGRTGVYRVTFPASSWNFELAAKTTIPKGLYNESDFSDWTAVRNNYKAYGYQYISIDFALSAGATIRAVGCFAKADGTVITTGGPTFTEGKTITWVGNCQTEEQKAYFTVYSNGKQVTENDTIKAGQWYTVVIKLLTDVTGYTENSYSIAAFALGNGKEVYFSNVRYYRNDTYKTDFVQAN